MIPCSIKFAIRSNWIRWHRFFSLFIWGFFSAVRGEIEENVWFSIKELNRNEWMNEDMAPKRRKIAIFVASSTIFLCFDCYKYWNNICHRMLLCAGMDALLLLLASYHCIIIFFSSSIFRSDLFVLYFYIYHNCFSIEFSLPFYSSFSVHSFVCHMLFRFSNSVFTLSFHIPFLFGFFLSFSIFYSSIVVNALSIQKERDNVYTFEQQTR